MFEGRTYRLLTAIAFLAMAGNGYAVTKKAQHPYRTEYKKKTFGKQAIAPVVGGAALNRGKGSFGQHLATGFEGHIVKNTVEYGVAGIRHEDLHYYRSTKKGFGPRMRHALVSTVVTRKTTTGRKTAATGKISGAAATGLIAGGAASGGIAIGADAGANVAREFWPRKHKRAQKKQG
jgi:hypothetical protein